MYKQLLSLLLLAVSMSACQLSETNIDPTRLAEVELRLLLPAAQTQAAYNQSALKGRWSAMLSQQLVNELGCGAVMRPDIVNAYWQDGLYGGVLKDCQLIIEQAEKEAQPHYAGIANILLAESLGSASSAFGDIPYSEALQGNSIRQPAYDLQEQLYENIQLMLDEAISALSQPAKLGGPTENDLIFQGDASKWLATARALKARFYLHLVKQDPQAAHKALAQLEAGTLSGLDDQPKFSWEGQPETGNPLARYAVERPNTLSTDKRFVRWMHQRQDPRQSVYFELDNRWGDSLYLFSHPTSPDLYWGRQDADIPLISYVEVSFLWAEALLRTGASDQAVEQQLQKGIAASFQQVGLDPVAHADFINSRSSLAGLDDFAAKLNRVMEEAYFAYYGFAFQEIWTNFRRSGFPALVPTFLDRFLHNPSGIIPRRFMYPSSEFEHNSRQVEKAIIRQGGKFMDQATWAFD